MVDVQVAELGLSSSYCLLCSSGEAEYGRRPSQSCDNFDLIISEINFFLFLVSNFVLYIFN